MHTARRLAVYLFCLVPHGSFADDPGIPAAISTHYQNANVCSVAEVRELAQSGEHILVELAIDPNWASSLAGADERLRRRWFGLHCPFRYSSMWAALRTDRDILVRGLLREGWIYTLSCRDFAFGTD